MRGAANGGPHAGVDLDRIEALLTEVKSQLDHGHRRVREALVEVQACGYVKKSSRWTNSASACQLPPSPTLSPKSPRTPRSPFVRGGGSEGKKMQLAGPSSEASVASMASRESECQSPLPAAEGGGLAVTAGGVARSPANHGAAGSDRSPRARPPRARERQEWRQQSPEFQGSDDGGVVLPAICSSKSMASTSRLPKGLPSIGSLGSLQDSRRTASAGSMRSLTSWLSARSWLHSLSKRPRQPRLGDASAMEMVPEMVEHDSVRSYDLRSLFGNMAKLDADSQNFGSNSLSDLKRWAEAADDQPSQMRRYAQRLVQRPSYEICVMLLIVANSVFLGCQVQHEAIYREPVRLNMEVEVFFCIAFILELAMKFYAGRRLFFFGSEASWNCFDVLVVALMLADLIVCLSVDDTSGVWAQASGLRILRILRVIRFMRSVRQLKFFSQLRIMIQSIMFSFRPLLWASIVLLGMFFVFGICLTQGVVDYLRKSKSWDDDSSSDLRTYFGSLERSMLSLFQAMSGGINWGDLLDVLSLVEVHFQCVFLFFVIFAVFGAANVVTGVFVEIANHWTKHDSHTQIQAESEQKLFCINALMDIFHEMDPNGHDRLTLESMLDAFREGNARVVNSLHALQLEVMDVRTLFLLLDRDRKGFISTEEFLLGCFRLKGEAKTLDIMKLQYQSEWVMHNLVRITEKLDGLRGVPLHPAEGDAVLRDEACPFRSLSAQVTSQQWQKVLGRGAPGSDAADGPLGHGGGPAAAMDQGRGFTAAARAESESGRTESI